MSDESASSTGTDASGAIPEHFFKELQVQFLVHELKDPLAIVEAGVRSLLERRAQSGSLSPRQERTLKRVLRGALKGRSLLNNLLEIGRSEAGQIVRKPFRPRDTVYSELLAAVDAMEGDLSDRIGEKSTEAEILKVLEQAGISLHVPAGGDTIEINQDEAKFSQIVANLIRNALRFRKSKLEIMLLQERETIVVEVIDDGPGVKPEDHARIFEPYVQAEASGPLARKGHGLGLAGALILARRLGGNVSVQSEAGQGATFRLVVPTK